MRLFCRAIRCSLGASGTSANASPVLLDTPKTPQGRGAAGVDLSGRPDFSSGRRHCMQVELGPLTVWIIDSVRRPHRS